MSHAPRFRRTRIPDVVVFVPPRFTDARGFLSETWSRERWQEAGWDLEIVQENHTFTRRRGTLRGLHFQTPPHAQDKLVRCLRGRSWHVAVDLRRSSPTLGEWVGVELAPEEWNQVLVPKGFAHGFCTLEEDSEILYKLTAPYRPQSEGGLRWDDPGLGIEWPLWGEVGEEGEEGPWLAERDEGWPDFVADASPFP